MSRPIIHKIGTYVAGGLSRAQALTLFPERDEIDGIVTDALAADSTVTDAAAAAVDAEILGRDILEAADILEDDPVFAVVDEDGRRTWLEAAADGGLTDHAVDKIGEHIAGAVEMDSEATGLTFTITDENGRRLWLEAGTGGKPSDYAIACITEGMGFGDVQVASGPAISAIGDSLTAGSGGDGTAYPSVLSVLTGRSVTNLGVGGEASATIAGRAGGRPWLATVSGDEIPASGGVTVTLAGDDGSTVAPLLQHDVSGDRGTNPVQIAGVEGTLSESSGTYTFTRSASGDAVTVARPTAVITQAMRERRGDITVMWWGQNDGASTAITEAIIDRQRATIQELAALDKRWLVLSPPTGTDASRATEEALYLSAFGRRYINIREYLATYAALDEEGITPTTQDDTDIAAGTVPTSLRSDVTHLNAAGYTRVAHAVYERMQEMGWL